MGLGVAEEGREDDGEERLTVVVDEAHNIVIAPVVQGSFCHLESQSESVTLTHTHTHTDEIHVTVCTMSGGKRGLL